jgi:nicotinamidase-related amidase
MVLNETAIVFIGFQNDYFSPEGILRSVIEESATHSRTLSNTLRLIDALKDTAVTLLQTPIQLGEEPPTADAETGILGTIHRTGAFRRGQPGSRIIDAFEPFQSRIETIPGKARLNAFSNTRLANTLNQRRIKNVCLAGAVTSICIDSTARAAASQGYNVSVFADCTASRSTFEQSFYCDNIFPLYATVQNSNTFIQQAA